MAGLTLDAGPLILADRLDQRIGPYLAAAARRTPGVLTVPASALAQAWRGPRNANLGRFLAGCELEAMSPDLARRAGVLCGLAGTSDIVDAAVMASAAQRGDAVLTTDYDDLARLALILPSVRVIRI